MHTSEELSSFTIENAMLDSSKSSIQHTIEQNHVASLLFIGQNSSPPLRRTGNSFDSHLKSELDEGSTLRSAHCRSRLFI